MPEDDRYQHYEVLKRADGSLWELGRGAMGVTYKAFDTDLRRAVALKVINSVYLRNDTARQRFLREARAAAALRHQNVASVFHLGLDHGDYFYAMEFIDGQTIDGYMKEHGRLTALEALDIAVQVTRALAMAARQGLVHRDLKPSNLMLVDEEGERVVKVIDFGLAKTVNRDGEESRSLTLDGSFLGTPHFASPEQLEERDIDARSDIYSLGATIYYLVAGSPPFTGSVAQIMSQHLYKPVPTDLLANFPASFANLILWMMEKDRDKRPQNAAELRQAMQLCLRELSGSEIVSSHAGLMGASQQSDTKATVTLTPSSGGTIVVGSVFAGKYRIDQSLPDKIAGKCYRGVDLRRQLKISLLFLNHQFLAGAERLAALQAAVQRVTDAPHPGLRQLMGFESVNHQTVLVEEFITAPSLLEILRARGLLSLGEVVAILERLAPVADHARLNGLEHVDFSLSGVQLYDAVQGQDTADLGEQVKRPLTKWSDLTPQVPPIDFVFESDESATWTGAATLLQPVSSLFRPKGSYVRQLSLLAYELLGGSRSTVENQGRYTPLAGLPEEGNHVLRRGLGDEIETAEDFARALGVGVSGRSSAIGENVPLPGEQVPRSGQIPMVSPVSERTDLAGVLLPSQHGAPQEAFSGGSILSHYEVVEKVDDYAYGWKYLADDLRNERRVSLLVLSSEIFSETSRFTALEEAVDRARGAPHRMLREIYSLETITECSFLVEEYVPGPSLLEVLRTRNVLNASEVAQLMSQLAQVADHATEHRLQHIDLNLSGIHLINPETTETRNGLLQRSLHDWESLEPKVDAIDFAFVPFQSDTTSGLETQVKSAPHGGSRGSNLRLLSLLGYELLGGPRARIESTGQYTPVAALTEEGNAILRRGLVDEYSSATELARELTAVVALSGPATRLAETSKRAFPEPPPRSEPPIILEPKKKQGFPPWFLFVGIALLLLIGVGAFLLNHLLQPAPVALPFLTVRSEPAGAALLLDGTAPQQPPGTFIQVPYGQHRLTATLNGYLPLAQDLQVQAGTAPELKLKLTLRPALTEIPALSIQIEPAGATILLDGKPPSTAPNTFAHVPFGTHELTATLDDYEPVKEQIQVGSGMNPVLRRQLKPIQEIPALSVQVEPASATVLLDGKRAQGAANTFTHVPYGNHQLSALLDDYEPLKQEIQVRKGTSPQIRLILKPIQEVASLAVQTEPAGAAVLLDGKPAQGPGNTFTHVPFGSHQLSATSDDYEPLKQEIQVAKGMNAQIRLELKPIRELAALSIQADPAGAVIALDGKPPETLPGTFTSVPFGTHRLTASADDYEPISRDIDVHKGMAPQMHLELKPIQEIAALSIQTDPAGASVLLDGKPPETPPNTFTRVPFGTHQLNVNLENYEPLTQTVEVRKGMIPELRLQLKKTQEADEETFEGFRRKAEAGDSFAMMKLGRLYLRKGTPADDVEGFKWLNRAYEAPERNLEAGAYVGDCYLSGKGTPQDVQKAEEVIMPLANQNVIPAMTLAGRLLEYKADLRRADAQASTSPKIQKKLQAQANDLDRDARQWWERAENDDWNAAAHLGQYYQEGWGGVIKSEDEAEKRYKKGTTHGNPLSMFFYGLMLEKKPGRHSEAETLIGRAAAAGLPSAIKWCKENSVVIPEIRADDKRQQNGG